MTQSFDDLETQVASTLKRLYPPAQVDPAQLTRDARTSQSHGTRTPMLVAAITIVTALAVLLPVTLLNGHRSHPPASGTTGTPPRWALDCLATGGPVSNAYNGLSVHAATSKAHALDHPLVLGARDGECLTRSFVFIPRQIVIAVANNTVVYARAAA